MALTKSRGERCGTSAKTQYTPPDAAAEQAAPVRIAPSREATIDARPIDAGATCTSIASPSRVAASRTTPPDLPYLLTVDETAALLRTTRKAIYARASRSQLPGAVRDGRRLLVRRDDLLQSLERPASGVHGSGPR